jgi:hypothetical protein
MNVGISIPVASSATLKLTRAKIVNNAGGGISASSGTVTISQSTISNNPGGGITLNGAQFTLQNNIIAGNGGPSSGTGGIKVDVANAGTHTIEFNTITNNGGPMNLNTGIHCGTVLVQLTFSNNIVYGNPVGGLGKQVGGAGCSFTYSDIGPGENTNGAGNINADPEFVNATAGNFHISGASPAHDAADPAATLATDFEGDQRPQGAARDIGADEVSP